MHTVLLGVVCFLLGAGALCWLLLFLCSVAFCGDLYGDSPKRPLKSEV